MKTILVVSYHFPPEEGSCSDKNLRIVKLLLDSGYKVVVLTKPGKEIKFNHKCLEVIRTKTAGIFHNVGSRSVSCTPNDNNSSKSKIKQYISNQLIPDSIIDWILPALTCVRLYKNTFQKCDLILSISSPYSAHIISYMLSKRLSIPYIMSYGDPWLYEPKRKRGFIRYNLERYLEGFLISNATKLLLITKWNKDKYISLYRIPDSKIYCYHIGFDRNDILDLKRENIEGAYKIIYGGSLDPVHRNPEPLISSMSKIDGVLVDIYCSDNPNVAQLIEEYGCNKKVSINNIISSNEFNELLYQYDALLLFGNKTPFQVPGKVFNYISTGKTIIYLKNNDSQEDGTQEVLLKYGNVIIINNNNNDIIDGFKRIKNRNCYGEKVNIEDFEFHKTMYPTINAIEDVFNELRK